MLNDMQITYQIETIDFKTPNSDKLESGLRISDDKGRSIVLDTDFNIVINCSYEHYYNNITTYTVPLL